VPPGLDVSAVAAGIMQADTNGDGEMDAGELAKAPAFVAAVGLLDRDGDKALSWAELESWLSDIRSSKVAIHSAAVMVKHKGRPLAARYNASSTLGAAVGGELPADGVFVFAID
jgi:hypothetical protein